MPSSSSNAPKAKTTEEGGTIDEEPDQDIPQYQKPPVVVPSRVNITIIRETLLTAYLDKKSKIQKTFKYTMNILIFWVAGKLHQR